MDKLLECQLQDERVSLVELKEARSQDKNCVEACNQRIADIDKQLPKTKQ